MDEEMPLEDVPFENVPFEVQVDAMTQDLIARALLNQEGFDVAMTVFIRLIEKTSEEIPADIEKVSDVGFDLLLDAYRERHPRPPEA